MIPTDPLLAGQAYMPILESGYQLVLWSVFSFARHSATSSGFGLGSSPFPEEYKTRTRLTYAVVGVGDSEQAVGAVTGVAAELVDTGQSSGCTLLPDCGLCTLIDIYRNTKSNSLIVI